MDPNFCRNEVERTSFEFICPFCFSPWYQEIRSTKFEICVNPNCSIYDRALGLKEPRASEELDTRRNSIHSEIILRLSEFDNSFIRRYLYETRRSIIYAWRTRTKGFDIPGFFALSELLLELNHHSPIGKSTSVTEVRDLVKSYLEYSKQINFLDDLLTLRIYMDRDQNVYRIKYWSAFNQMLENYGITHHTKVESEDLFKYLDVDAKAIKPFDPTKLTDLSEYFKNTFLHSARLRLLFGLHKRTSQIFKYKVYLIDVAALVALFFSIQQATECWPIDRLRELFQRNVPVGYKREFTEFRSQFIDSKELSPIILRSDDACYVDRDTLLFFLHYLVGNEVETPEGNKIQMIGDTKNVAANSFEGWIGNELVNKKYAVTSGPIEVAKHEYDVIAVNEDLKRILLIEAKYKDFSPSAISGRTLLEQELYDDKEGLLIEAIRQLKRHDFFLSQPDRFTKLIPAIERIGNYAVSSFVVTKYQPLISK